DYYCGSYRSGNIYIF
nr:immunoglobulin light chain junction region [Macaca mulatta]